MPAARAVAGPGEEEREDVTAEEQKEKQDEAGQAAAESPRVLPTVAQESEPLSRTF